MESSPSEQGRLEALRIEGHDLRSPVANIRTYASMVLAREGIDARTRRALEIIVKNADRALALIDERMDSLRAEEGMLELRTSPCPLGSVVRMAIADEKEAFEEAGIEVRTAIDDDLPPFELDVGRVRNAVRALLAAARRRAPADSRVEVRLAPQGDRVRVEVEDQGPRPDAAEQAGAFDSGFQMRASRRLSTGLGMALARAMARAHGGEAGMAPTPTGAVHFLEFPFSRS